LFASGKVLRTYPIALGGNPIGVKTREGDRKTPEGIYLIDGRNARSAYHLALHISYPSPADVERARRTGVNPGGDIMIHGWTRGCIAVTNPEIEEIWAAVPDGTPIELRP